jgi:hypothetical protein
MWISGGKKACALYAIEIVRNLSRRVDLLAGHGSHNTIFCLLGAVVELVLIRYVALAFHPIKPTHEPG